MDNQAPRGHVDNKLITLTKERGKGVAYNKEIQVHALQILNLNILNQKNV